MKTVSYLLIFCTAAFLLRALVFWGYIRHEERYCQPDSNDYHFATLCLTNGMGMYDIRNGRPLFWRTPGYPYYLSHFYTDRTVQHDLRFTPHAEEQQHAIWLQILLCSLLPLLMFALAWILTRSKKVAWYASGVSVFHVGFVLASTFLLTDALAMLFFLGFLIFFFAAIPWFSEQSPRLPRLIGKHPQRCLIFSALLLAMYTWIRPHGQFVALCGGIIIFISHMSWGTRSLKKQIMPAALFLITFIAAIAPWCYRNYQITGSPFFCPLFGLYFNVFNAPKIVARVEKVPLQVAHKNLSVAAAHEVYKTMQEYHATQSPYVVCQENICMRTAWPVIKAHPFLFIRDWIVETTKTTFDLYSYQLVALYHNCFKWDPMVEYLPEKIAACLWEKELPAYMRLIAWLEALWMLCIWIGILGGFFQWILVPWHKKKWPARTQHDAAVWLICGAFCALVALQTGGFGYARLRLPIEPLMIIVGLYFWFKPHPA